MLRKSTLRRPTSPKINQQPAAPAHPPRPPEPAETSAPAPAPSTPAGGGALLTPADAAKLLSVTDRVLERWRSTGDGPAYIQLSRKTIRYRGHDLAAFIAGSVRTSTAA